MDSNTAWPSRLRIGALVIAAAAATLALFSPVPLRDMFRSDGFMPHGHCYLWLPKLVTLHVVSDTLIGTAYVAISVTLAYLVHRVRSEIPFSWMFLAFGAFIIACGATHYMEVWTLWHPTYWLAGDVKLLTALASVTTAIALPPLVPRVLRVIQTQRVAEEQAVELATARERERLLVNEQEARTDALLSKSRLAAIVESSDDAIVGKDLSGTIISWNAGAERMFGYRADEAIGQPIYMLAPEESRDEESHILQTLARGERIDHFETQRVRKDGTRVDVSISVSPIKDPSGRVAGAANITRDVTARKAVEAERERLLAQARAAQAQAEAANRAKDTFLATVSHELRTPLSPILAWARMLREGRVGDDKARHALAIIERNARAQGQLVDDLLDVSRIVTGKLRLEVRSVELAPIVQAAVDVVRPAADAKGIRVHVVLDTETGPVAGDPDRLQQVLWNLLSNAIKFTPKNGRVQVVLERVNSHVEIAVSDTGQGIAPAFLPHVFTRFEQADSGTGREHGGLGLGLAIVRHIVELHGGTVHVESAGLNQGTTFTVKLPLVLFARTAGEIERRHPTIGGPPAEMRYPELKGLRVLVVDDDPDGNDVVSTLLSSCGAEVRVAASAAQAIELLARWQADIVVTDIGMPGDDGYALLAKIDGRRGDLGRIPVIALTAYATTEDRVRLLAAGFHLHIAKPIEPAELIAGVANAARTTGRL